MYKWNGEGPVYGPNGELELDPENQDCNTNSGDVDEDIPKPPIWAADGYARPVFATCKNNCPGGELIWSFILS